MSKITAYNGNKPFIFISYAHKDSALVYPVIEELQKGYNVWFDEGIGFGQEWADNIAKRLKDCALFLYFVSQNSVDSENCMDEIYYARDNKKPFINIVIQNDIKYPDSFFRYLRYQQLNILSYPSIKDAISDLIRKAQIYQAFFMQCEKVEGYTARFAEEEEKQKLANLKLEEEKAKKEAEKKIKQEAEKKSKQQASEKEKVEQQVLIDRYKEEKKKTDILSIDGEIISYGVFPCSSYISDVNLIANLDKIPLAKTQRNVFYQGKEYYVEVSIYGRKYKETKPLLWRIIKRNDDKVIAITVDSLNVVKFDNYTTNYKLASIRIAVAFLVDKIFPFGVGEYVAKSNNKLLVYLPNMNVIEEYKTDRRFNQVFDYGNCHEAYWTETPAPMTREHSVNGANHGIYAYDNKGQRIIRNCETELDVRLCATFCVEGAKIITPVKTSAIKETSTFTNVKPQQVVKNR